MAKNKEKKEGRMKFKPIAPPRDDTVTNEDANLIDKLDNTDTWSYSDLDKFTSLAERRDQRYIVYDQMRQNDSLASAVLEMYADDITLPDSQGRSIWVESDNANIADAGNRLIRILRIDDDIWANAYSLVCYGDVYYELFRTKQNSSLFTEDIDLNDLGSSKNARLMEAALKHMDEAQIKVHKLSKYYAIEDYVERITDPSEIFDLVNRGRTVGYARTHVNETKGQDDGWNSLYDNWTYKMNRSQIDIYDAHKFIHIYVPDAGVRHPYKFILDPPSSDDDTKVVESDSSISMSSEYTVSTGKSLLQDAYKTSQQLQLAENSILLSRLTRSSIFRLLQVNVGQKSDKDTISLLNRIKALFDKKQTFDTNAGTMSSYNNPGPEVATIVMPTKENGQGTISVSNIGGDYDPKSLADLDYLINKELAAFKVPRQFLNFTDGGGFNGGSSLAKISSQYAHRIVRYKRAITTGITTMLNIFFDNRYPDYVGKFEVKMTPISTVEDAERVAMARDKLGMVGEIMDQLDAMEDVVAKFKVLKDIISDAYPNSTINQVLDDYIKKLEATPQEPPKVDDSTKVGGNSGGGSDSSFLTGGDSGGSESSVDDTSNDDSFASDSASGSSEFPTDLSGEGIDLTDTDAVDAALGEEE